MRYTIIDQQGLGLLVNNYFFQSENIDGKTKVTVRSKTDYSPLLNVTIDEEVWFSSIVGQTAYLYSYKKPGCYQLDLTSGDLNYANTHLIPEYRWKDGTTLFLDRVENEYKFLNDNGKLLFQLKSEFPVVNRWHECGLIQFFNDEKTNNWIRCIDTREGTEKWKLDYSWKIVSCDEYENLLVLNYHAYENLREDDGFIGERHWSKPNRYIVVIDAETGHEMWSKKLSYGRLDRTHGILLAGDKESILEVKIESGIILTNCKPVPEDSMGYTPSFVDEQGIYYTNHYGGFGKIRKSDGFIDWQFQLQDNNGVKRKLSNWTLLDNGNLVLDAISVKESPFMCIFDPKENLVLSEIKNGVRV